MCLSSWKFCLWRPAWPRVLQSHLSAFSSFGRCVLNCSVPPEILHRGHCFEIQSTFKGNAIAISLNFQKQMEFTHLSNQWVLPPTVLSSSGKTRKIKGKQKLRISSFSDWNSVPKLGQLYFSNEDNHTRLGTSVPLWIKNKKNLLERITFKSHQTFLVFTAFRLEISVLFIINISEKCHLFL